MQNDVVKLCGLTKSEIEKKLENFKLESLSFSVDENNLDAKITLGYVGSDKNAYEILKSRICNEFSANLYSSKDVHLNEFACGLLKRSRHMLSVAESLTGGAVASSIVDVAGVSSNFFEGIVCYNSESKTARLKVSEKTLAENGAISRKTAVEMVKGLLLNPRVTLGLSTTGNAGPTADEGKPVGLVYIAVGSGDFITAFEHRFSGSRNEIREKAKNMALFYLVRFLLGNILLL